MARGVDSAEPSGSTPWAERPLADVAAVRALLVAAARDGSTLTYSRLLFELGHRFSRPKMRAVCRTLAAVDEDAAVRDEPELAVLVVREADHLPGAGWWSGARALALGLDVSWSSDVAAAHVAELQRLAFEHWSRVG